MIKKICFDCYSELFPDKPITKITLGRQCLRCKKSTDRGEQMIPVETEDEILAIERLPNESQIIVVRDAGGSTD